MKHIDDADWVAVRTFAYRLKGEEGWHLVKTELTADEVNRRLTTAGSTVLELRQIKEGLAMPNLERYAGLDPVDPWMLWQDDDWDFDYLAQCWRAPGEPLWPLPGQPTETDQVRVHFDTPAGGWIPITIAAGQAQYRFSISYVWDPLLGFGSWPIGLVEEEWSRFAMDIEGPLVKLLAFPAAQASRVRFMIVEDGGEGSDEDDQPDEDSYRRIPIDIVIDRRTLVAAFYDAFQEFWNGDRFRENLNGWDWHGSDRQIYSRERLGTYRSGKVEAFLGRPITSSDDWRW